MAVAVRRIVDPDRSGPPRIVVLLVGNGARETSLRGRPPSAHLALVRALCDVPNVALLRVHEAGTTKFTVNARFGDEPALELAHPFPGLPLVRGLRISARAGLVFNRDDLSGAWHCPPTLRAQAGRQRLVH